MTNFNGVKIRRIMKQNDGTEKIVREKLYSLEKWNAAKDDYASGVKEITTSKQNYNRIEFRTIMENVMNSYEV